MSESSYSNKSEACSSRTSDDAIVSEKDKEAGSLFLSSRTIDHISGLAPDLPSIQEHMIVDFDGLDDPSRSMNWKMSKKVYVCMLYGLLNCGATWATSSFSVAIPEISKEFNVPWSVATLGTTLYLFGFGLGPLLWAPLSEVYGRKISALAPSLIGMMFIFGTATGKDIQTVLITQFFADFFASAPITNSGGVLSDLFPPQQRGTALAGYSVAVAGGPLLAPVVGNAFLINGLSWRWTEYINGMIMALGILLASVFVDESDPNVILTNKARHLRMETAPIVFMEIRGWNSFVGSLPFLSTLIGSLLGMAINVANNGFYAKRVQANHGRPVPEARLPPMMLGGVAFAAGLFLFGWTSNPNIHWIGPVFGAGLIGLGFLTVFQAALNYLIDTFISRAASALASNVVIRCLFAGAFPLAAGPMFHNLGANWASSVLGFVAAAMIPIPILFYIYGRRIRMAGKLSRPSTE